MTYLSTTELGYRAVTSGIASDDVTALLTDIDAVINAYLQITTNTTDTATLARILPIAKRMARMDLNLHAAEKCVDKSTVAQIMYSMTQLGLSDPVQLTTREKAELDEVWWDTTPATGKTAVCGVFSMLDGRRIY